VTTITEEEVKAPTPFDLTTLQTEAYKNHGYTPSQTLRVAQKLYLAGIISYPRTSSQQYPKENDGEYKKKQLWEKLPKKMMYQTYGTIIDYLLTSGKISVDAEGKIGWIFYPEAAQKRFEKAHLRWRGVNKNG